MLLVAPHPIVERDFLAWKSALPISLTIPRPSTVESSCEDPTYGEPSSHDLPLHEEKPSRETSAGIAAPAANASQPHWWTRMGRWFTRSVGNADTVGFVAGSVVADSSVEAAGTVADTAASSALAEQCLDALRKFEVADKTPMECMLFIAELKKRFLKI